MSSGNLHDLSVSHYLFEFLSSVHRLEMLLPQRIVGQNNLLSFCKGWSGVSYAKGDMKGSIEHLYNLNNSYNELPPDHFTQ